ncbi:AAA family ATPase [Chloroflexota bacterium]
MEFHDPFQSRRRPAAVSIPAARALTPLGQLEWYLPGVIARPGLNLVLSTFWFNQISALLDLAVCAALGVPWLGRPLHQAAVLWFFEPRSQHGLFKRLGQVMRAHHAPAELPFRLAAINNYYDLYRASFLNLLSAEVERTGAALVIFESMACLPPGLKEDDLDPLRLAIFKLQTYAVSTNTAVVLLHDHRQPDLLAANPHVNAYIDHLLTLRAAAHTDYLEIRGRPSADYPDGLALAARIHFDPDFHHPERVWLTPAALSQARYALSAKRPPSPAVEHVLDYLTDHGPSITKRIIESAPNATRSQIFKAIYKLIDAGLIKRIDSGGWGQTATYALVEE